MWPEPLTGHGRTSGFGPAGGVLAGPLSVLFEENGLPGWGLPGQLASGYGGDLGFPELCVYGNFVASIDGVTALGPEYPSSGSAISDRDPADRFVMGLLRACADVVLIGAGTLRATPRHLWTPGHVCPPAAAGFRSLRRELRQPPAPELVVVSGRGDLPVTHPALLAGAIIATTTAGARQLAGQLPPACTVLDLGDRPALSLTDVVGALRARGAAAVLTEGGPRLLGQLVADGLLNELFLTVSPVLAGRAGTSRPGLLAGLELLPARREQAELISVRQHGSELFLRYRLGAAPAEDALGRMHPGAG